MMEMTIRLACLAHFISLISETRRVILAKLLTCASSATLRIDEVGAGDAVQRKPRGKSVTHLVVQDRSV